MPSELETQFTELIGTHSEIFVWKQVIEKV